MAHEDFGGGASGRGRDGDEARPYPRGGHGRGSRNDASSRGMQGDWEDGDYGREGGMGRGDAARGGRDRERGGGYGGRDDACRDRGRFGFDGAGYVGGNVDGYGRGGALDYGRGGFDVGGPPEAWGLGDTRHSSGMHGWGGGRHAGDDPYSGGAGYGGIGYGGGGHGTGGRDFGHAASGGRGGFAGRGPKGYKRSDARIEEEISEALMRHPAIDASEVEVRVRDGEVMLTGTVDSRGIKRLIEDIAHECMGVLDVSNQIRVARPGDAAGGGGSASGEREVPRDPGRE